MPQRLLRTITLAAALLAIAAASTASAAEPATAFAAEPTAVHKARLNGVDIAYQEYGQGEPLLLLHGYGGCAATWAPLIPALAANHRVIVPELRGHGHSGDYVGPFRASDAASDVLALLDHLQLPRVQSIGISAGGMTLLHVATRQPARIDAMVLVGAANYLPAQARAILASELPPFVVEEFRACAPRGQAQLDRLMTTFNGLKDSYDDVNFTAPLLGTIQARTLIVHGDDDIFFPVEIALDMHRAIAGSQLWIVPGGGHVPILDQQQREFEAVATRFLEADVATGQ